MRADIVPGGVFPDYTLPDHTGVVRTLSELQGRDPLVLTLARGHYCPKEHQQHLELAAFQPKIAVAYTQIVTISTDEHHELQEFRASVGAGWTFLEGVASISLWMPWRCSWSGPGSVRLPAHPHGHRPGRRPVPSGRHLRAP